MKVIEIILEIIGWFTIVIGVTLGAALIAFVIYKKWDNQAGRTIAIIICCIGFIAGAIWATRIWKKHGTIAWLSQIRKIS